MTEIDSLLPLPVATFHILLALADEDRHGYAIIQDVEARTGGELKLSAGTLYRSIQRMLEQALLVETREPPAPEHDDERRRNHRISATRRASCAGRRALRSPRLRSWRSASARRRRRSRSPTSCCCGRFRSPNPIAWSISGSARPDTAISCRHPITATGRRPRQSS